jgi:hypothetical protein
VDPKTAPPAQEPSDIGDDTFVLGRLAENEEEILYAAAVLAPTGCLGRSRDGPPRLAR